MTGADLVDPVGADTASEPADESEPSPRLPDRIRQRRSRSAAGQKWMRLVHVYTSMIAMLVVLFFGATGLTLNHPNWTFGMGPSTSTRSGRLPSGSVGTDGKPAFLTISEYLRDHEHLHGSVSGYGVTGTQGYITYQGPGYEADVTFDTSTRRFRIEQEQQGIVAVLNDLHKGRNTDRSWGWVIDVAAVFLVVISLTGIGLQLFLRRRRRSAMVVAAVGAVIVVVAAILTVR